MPIPLIAAGAAKLLGAKAGGAAAKGALSKGAGGFAGSGMGSTLSKLLGPAQLVSGLIKRRQADAALPNAEDLGQRQMLNILRRRRRAIETGTAGSSESAAMRQMVKSAGANAFKAGGPMNFGALNQMIAGASQNMAAQRAQELPGLLGQEGALINERAQRFSDLSMYRSQVKSAQAEENISAGQDNLLAGIGGGKKKKKKVSGATDGSSDMA